jgi:tryptophan-rich sensory protein
VAIGLAYYGACFFGLWRLFAVGETARACIVLLVVVMAANAFWNYFFFRRKDFRLSFWYQAPYAAVAIAFLGCVAPVDGAVAVVFGIYLLYWPYALAWTYEVWKLNRNSTGNR